MRHIAFFAALTVAAPALAQSDSPADATTQSPSPADTSNPASMGDTDEEQEERMKLRYVPKPPPPAPRYEERSLPRGDEIGYPPPHEPETPRR